MPRRNALRPLYGVRTAGAVRWSAQLVGAAGQRSSFGGVRSLSTLSTRSSSPHTTYRYVDV